MAKHSLADTLLQGTSTILGTLAGTVLLSSAALAQINPSPSIFCEPEFRERFAERCGVTPEADTPVGQAAPSANADVMSAETDAAMPESDMAPEADMSMPEADAPVSDMDMMSEDMMSEEMTDEADMMEEATADTMEAMPEEAAEASTIVDVAASNDSFETLVAAIEAAGLVETLSGEGPFTVFAPTDEAFAALPEGVLEQLLLPENRDMLVSILTYHVVPGKVTSSDIAPGEVSTVEGSSVSVAVEDGQVAVNEATVIMADVEASNGVIHAIDQVILPPELSSMVPGQPNS